MPRLIVCLTPLLLAGSALSAELSTDDLQIHGMSIRVPAKDQTLVIDPLERKTASATGMIPVVAPTWRNGFRLPGVAWTYGALTPGSVKVFTVAAPQRELHAGKDFVVNDSWATIGAVESSNVAPGTELRFDYAYTESRIDLIESRADGSLAVKKGEPHMNAPLVPAASPGCEPLIGVYLPHNTTALSLANVNFITSTGPLIPPIQNAGPVQAILGRAERGEPVTIAFLGDSITAQNDVQGGSFVDRFTEYLRQRFPMHRVTVTSRDRPVSPQNRQLVVVKAGVGGDNSRQGLARFESDVARHHPQIVVVMFGANDENRRPRGGTAVSVDEYRQNLETMIQRSRQIGAETIILSPAMKNAHWVATSGLMDAFADAARQAAEAHAACFVDVHDAWRRIGTVGSNYMVYLNSSINHPNHLGHQLFFDGLQSAVERD